LAQKSGLDLIDARSPAFPLNMYGVGQYPKRFAIKFSRAILERLLSVIFFDGMAIALDTNLLAVWMRPAHQPS